MTATDLTMPDPTEVLAYVRKALTRIDPETGQKYTLARIQRGLEEGGYPPLEELLTAESAMPQATVAPVPAVTPIQAPFSNIPVAGNPYIGPGIQQTPRELANKAILVGQGAALNFGDRLVGAGAALIPGGKGYTEARNAARERIATAKEETPGAGALTMAGSVLSPANLALMGSGLLRPLPTVVGRLLQYGLGGPAVGAALGAIPAAGAAPDIRQMPAYAKEGAIQGAKVGAAVGLLGAAVEATPLLWRQTFGKGALFRGPELGEDLRLKAVGGQSAQAERAAIGTEKGRIRQTYYKPLEKLGPIEDNDAILDVVGNRTIQPLLPKEVGVSRGPYFRELQAAQKRLIRARDMAFNAGRPEDEARYAAALDELESSMSTLPGYVESTPLWARVMSRERFLKEGMKKFRLTDQPQAWEIREIIASAPDAESQFAFRVGGTSRIVAQLRRELGGHTPKLEQLFNAGPEITDKLRMLFGSDAEYTAFMRGLALQKSAAARARYIKTVAPWAVVSLSAFGGGAFGVSVLRAALP